VSLVLYGLSLLGDSDNGYETVVCGQDDVLRTYLGREEFVYTQGDIDTKTVFCPRTVVDIKHRKNKITEKTVRNSECRAG
jgi:hypothetical protein